MSTTQIVPGTPISYGTTSPVQMMDIHQTIFPPTPLAPPVVTTMVPDVLPVPKPHTITDTGPPKQTRPPQQRATNTPRLRASNTTADIAAIDGTSDPDRRTRGWATLPNLACVRYYPHIPQLRALTVPGQPSSLHDQVNHGRQTPSPLHLRWEWFRPS